MLTTGTDICLAVMVRVALIGCDDRAKDISNIRGLPGSGVRKNIGLGGGCDTGQA